MTRRTFFLGIATASAAAATGCVTQPTPSNPTSLRVMAYNLHHGEGVDGRLDLERIAAVIRGANPDLVALQEVDRKATRTGGIDQAAEYARLTGLHVWYGGAMPFQGGEYGQALLSRWPLEEPRVVRLPGTAGREPRIAVSAFIQVPGLGRIRWVGLHLDASREDGDRWEQAGALLKEWEQDPTPTLLAGDFNATPESRVMRRLLDPGTPWEDTAGTSAAPTIPAEAPRSRIDFVLASPRGFWKTLESKVIPEAVASDHRPLIVTLQKAS
jgi:endonuclease/exonuclease/phosphatase family metal-dependent hydrolase